MNVKIRGLLSGALFALSCAEAMAATAQRGEHGGTLLAFTIATLVPAVLVFLFFRRREARLGVAPEPALKPSRKQRKPVRTKEPDIPGPIHLESSTTNPLSEALVAKAGPPAIATPQEPEPEVEPQPPMQPEIKPDPLARPALGGTGNSLAAALDAKRQHDPPQKPET